MVNRTITIVGFGCALMATSAALAGDSAIDIVRLAATWPQAYVLAGTKTEPTYVEHIRLEREGDRFVLEGGGPMGTPTSRESLMIGADRVLRHIDCPTAMHCESAESPSGFLASAAILAAIRGGELTGKFSIHPYGDIAVICIPAERIGIRDPILDPCIDTRTGAVVAQRHRLSKQFDGPSLDPWSISLSAPESRISSLGYQ